MVLDLQPVIGAIHLDDPAHLVQARTHALRDAVSQRLLGRGSLGLLRLRKAFARLLGANARGRKVREVCSNQRGLLLVVAIVQDVADCVPHPLGRADGPKLIEKEDFSLKNRSQDFQFRSLHAGIVGILYLLKQLAIIAKQAGDAFVADELVQNAHSQMGLAHADGSGEEQAGALKRIILYEKYGVQFGYGQRLVKAGPGLKIFQRTMLVAYRNVGRFDHAANPRVTVAAATRRSQRRSAGDMDKRPATTSAGSALLP